MNHQQNHYVFLLVIFYILCFRTNLCVARERSYEDSKRIHLENPTKIPNIFKQVGPNPNVNSQTSIDVGEHVRLQCHEQSNYGYRTKFRWIRWKKNFNPTKLQNIGRDIVKNKLHFTNYPFVEEIPSSEYKVFIHMQYDNKGRFSKLHGSDLTLSQVTEDDQGYYSCVASNSFGFDFLTRYVAVNKVFPRINILKVVLIALGVGLIFGIIIIAVCKLIKLRGDKQRVEEEVEEIRLVEIHRNDQQGVPHEENVHIIDSSPAIVQAKKRNLKKTKEELYHDPQVLLNTVDPKWEVDRKSLIILQTLGSGAFGIVMKATLPGGLVHGERKTVAVKIPKENAKRQDFLLELVMLKHIGQHKHIINFLGCCTEIDPIYIIVEYAPHGNLRMFLRSKRPLAMDQQPFLTTKDLISFSSQVAQGMEFLASKKCIHRDLAARNVLLGEYYVIKIADFGLARSLNNADYYQKTTNGRFPVKWVAIEALLDRVYSTQSDIWAYGVLLWEIFTLGGTPYPRIPVQDLYKVLKDGYRMKRPKSCPPLIYEIMGKCWIEEPSKRPSFSELVAHMESLLDELTSDDIFEFKSPDGSLDNQELETDEENELNEQRSLMSDGYAFFDDESALTDDGYNGTWSCKKSS
ncbi:fibroblast growth factor receptor 3-like [Clytia hemisphaerica]|uniref:fibroblast growth factor receptor 3-like n=1 Tax=Clytia hemisphaerica TaxID=252671 RepID=UPI0034D4B8CC